MLKKFAAIAITPAFILTTLLTTTPVTAKETYVTIGTGGQTGVYYVVGQSICRLVNRNHSEHGVKCTAPSTGGSIANLNAIASGEQDMGVVQSDWQYHAYHGTSTFSDTGANETLRALFSVHPEPFTVVARKDSNIAHFDDLKGKRVNIGNPGSGQHSTMQVVMNAKGWTMADFKLVAELKAAEQAQALCDNNIDAMIYVAGHPNGSIQEATTSCETVLVPVDGEVIQTLIDNHPYYAKVIIPGGMYEGSPEDTPTFGVLATFVSSTKAPEETIYQVVKAVFDNFDRFQKLHPAFVHLKPETMIKDGLSIPLHAGAMKYYQEQGWKE